ncbi:Dehydrogenase (flavoprotein) [Goodfellowiella coeruleoviolacea]|uniref:Dehydrogenase (Flavoprotein) n=2 Tax=Goodfellowiella coeruleoviolacea TaxID=334858 RepID=A0AAE3GHU1_9PSEU|nr:Dehydrogenase (flavoprotein) [Goodfellowiella coeruleoviolacea]
MLAATSLAAQVDQVTVVDRDRLPDDPRPRSGVPQARHTHLLMSGGARTIDRLLPGTLDRLIARGARRIGIPNEMVSLSAQGWIHRFPEIQFMVSCSRGLLDWVVRTQALANPRITVRDHTDVLGLDGDRTRVTGVLVADRGSGTQERLPADITVDATGRGSKMRRWLEPLGLPAAREETVDSGLAYATRVFQAPAAAARRFPLINIQASPQDAEPGKTATLLPIEEGRWMVTLSGTRGGEPPTDEDRFVDFARSVRHPLVGDLIATARPLSGVYSSHSTVNRRVYYERLPVWPDGLVVLGDALATFNPVYGHGMSVAAHSAATLGAGLRRYGLATPGTTRRIQRALARTVDTAWVMATSQDILYPGAVGKPQPRLLRLSRRYVDRLSRAATREPRVTAAMMNAFTLSAPMTSLLHPAVVLATLRGPRRPPLAGPTITQEERDFCVEQHPSA